MIIDEVLAFSDQEAETCRQCEEVTLCMNSLGTTRLFLADPYSLCQKKLGFLANSIFLAAFIPLTRFSPRQVGKIYLWLQPSHQYGTRDSGVSLNKMRVEAIDDNIKERKRTGP
jgi:hypothetical protein